MSTYKLLRRLLVTCVTLSLLFANVREFVVKCDETQSVVRILCFGDSLTFGLTNSPNGFQTTSHPYTTKLQEYFDRTPQGGGPAAFTRVQLDNAGLSGQKVREHMLPRLTGLLQGATPKYNWVIILGGTNDLCGMKSIWSNEQTGQDVVSIFNAIVQLHDTAHEFGAKTVAMTIPAIQCETMMDVRLKINNMIRGYAAGSSGKAVLADLDGKLARNHLLACDGVHLTATAYDEMAGIIYDSMKQYI